MSAATNGGPAFPVPGLQNDDAFNGMTLRDYFAAKALQGFCANEQSGMGWASLEIARASYSLADAMLTARAALATASA